MIQTDCQYYKTVMSAVGRTMLIFLLLINVYGAGINFLSVLLDILSVISALNQGPALFKH